jgi:hypothetical protein
MNLYNPKFRLRSQTLQQHDIEPANINVARKIYFTIKDHDKLWQHKIPRLSNQRDYLE